MYRCDQNNSFTRITFKSQVEKFSIKSSEDKIKIFFSNPQPTTERFQSKIET